MNRLRTILLGTCLAAAASAAPGQTRWNVADGNWSVPANWTAGEPGQGTDAHINRGTAHITQAGEVCYQLFLGYAATEKGNLYIQSGSLAVQVGIDVGVEGEGYVKQTGGDVTVVGNEVGYTDSNGWYWTYWFSDVWLGAKPGSEGRYDLSGGSLTADRVMVGSRGKRREGYPDTYNYGGVGKFNLSGGSLTAEELHIGNADAPGFGVFTWTGGSLNAASVTVHSNGTMTVGQDWIHGGSLTVSGSLDLGVRYLVIQGDPGAGASGWLGSGGEIKAYSLDLGWYEGTVGTFTQSGGTVDLWDAVAVGTRAGAQGTYNMTGGYIESVYMYIGYRGQGKFTQSGGLNDTGLLDIGKYAGAEGTYELKSSSAQLTPSTVHVGRGGTGRFTQTAGTHTIGTDLHVGTESTGVGTYTQSGGQLDCDMQYIGEAGAGTFTHTGGTNTAYSLSVGPAGSYSLSGTAALSASNESVRGLFTHSAGTNTVGSLSVAAGSGAPGTYDLSGTGRLTAGSEGVSGAATDWGAFNQSGGTNTMTGHLYVGGGGGYGEYLLDGGHLGVSGTIYVGYLSTGMGELSWLNGTLSAGEIQIGPNSKMTVRNNWIYDRTIRINGGTLDLGSAYLVLQAPGAGAYAEMYGGLLKALSLDLGWYETLRGRLVQAAGQVNLTTDLYIGSRATASGDYQLADGTLSAQGAYVGYRGTGTFSQSGGTNMAQAIHVGYLTGARGTYWFGGGTISGGGLYLGKQGGTGTFTWIGGTLDVNQVEVYSGSTMQYQGSYDWNYDGQLRIYGGTVDFTNAVILEATGAGASGQMTGGAFKARRLELGHAAGRRGAFTQSGGQTTIGQTLHLGYDALSAGTYDLQGSAALSAPTQYVGYGGQGQFNQYGGANTVGELCVGTYAGSTGTYRLAGGSLSAGTIRLGWQGGFGQFNFSSGALSAAGIEVYPSGQMQVMGIDWTFQGRLQVLGGLVNTSMFPLTLDNDGIPGESILTGGSIDSGTLTIAAQRRARLVQSGGVNRAMTISIGDQYGAAGSYGMTGGLLEAWGLFVGRAGAGTFDHAGGRVEATGTSELQLGSEATGVGMYSLYGSGAVLSLGAEVVGGAGRGEFRHIAGTNLVARALDIGRDAGGTGLYVIRSGRLAADSISIAASGQGTFEVHGGSADIDAATFQMLSGQANLLSDLATSGVSLIEVTGPATLDGLWTVLEAGVAIGRYDVLRAGGGIGGAFDQIVLPGPNWRWGIEGGTTLYVEYIPEPGSAALLALGALLLPRRRGRR